MVFPSWSAGARHNPVHMAVVSDQARGFVRNELSIGRLERFEFFTEYEATNLMMCTISVCIDMMARLEVTPTSLEVSALTQAVAALS